MDHSTLIDEIAAEIELSLPDAAHRTASRLRRLQFIRQGLSEAGFIRKINIDPFDSRPINITGVSTAASSLSAYGGLLIGTSSLAYGLRISRTDVLETWQISRVSIGDIDFAGKDERIRWKQLRLIYEVLEALLDDGRSQIILLDLPLFISRREEATIVEDPNIAEEWRELEERVNTFWSEHLNRLYPFKTNGIVVASLRPHSASSLFAALYKNINTSPDVLTSELQDFLHKEETAIHRLGQSRILEQVLTPKSRSIAYSFEDLDVDPRWQPRELHHTGILGFFMRTSSQTDVWHIQIPGHRSQWTSETIDHLANRIIRATLHDSVSAIPLPLWYAQQMVKFPKELLIIYRDQIKKELTPNE